MFKRTKMDIQTAKLAWDSYANAAPGDAAAAMYDHARVASDRARAWYWQSIASKRRASLGVRATSFGLLILGAVLPIVAALWSDAGTRLVMTQIGVIALAAAGLLHAGDRIFGWSSGWMRYITTVTAMENATGRFELDWSNYMLGLTQDLSNADKRPLFELARRFEEEIDKLRSDETDKWVAEFNSGLALMSDLIKTQRESAEKTAEAAREALAARAAGAEQRLAAARPGAIELALAHNGSVAPLRIRVDDGGEESFTGAVWSRINVAPGLHTVHVATSATPPLVIRKVVEVPAGGVARLDVKLA